eukprot:gene21136-biopygen5640
MSLGAARHRPGGARSVAALGVDLAELVQQRRARRARRRGDARHQERRDAHAPLRERRRRHRLRPRSTPMMRVWADWMDVRIRQIREGETPVSETTSAAAYFPFTMPCGYLKPAESAPLTLCSANGTPPPLQSTHQRAHRGRRPLVPSQPLHPAAEPWARLFLHHGGTRSWTPRSQPHVCVPQSLAPRAIAFNPRRWCHMACAPAGVCNIPAPHRAFNPGNYGTGALGKCRHCPPLHLPMERLSCPSPPSPRPSSLPVRATANPQSLYVAHQSGSCGVSHILPNVHMSLQLQAIGRSPHVFPTSALEAAEECGRMTSEEVTVAFDVICPRPPTTEYLCRPRPCVATGPRSHARLLIASSKMHNTPICPAASSFRAGIFLKRELLLGTVYSTTFDAGNFYFILRFTGSHPSFCVHVEYPDKIRAFGILHCPFGWDCEPLYRPKQDMRRSYNGRGSHRCACP